ncbi:hypothetical protein AB0F17_03195 [Nonomuraea sp. NPDC026600]|uniref:hypothetical protein n=1 Tax=Nonomuraea sp. NPDC026600 TaxID=3155363 RepID=UPI0033D8ECFB
MITLPRDLLRYVLVEALGVRDTVTFDAETVRSWEMNDWADFKAEYPDVEGEADAWLERLSRALRSTFETS